MLIKAKSIPANTHLSIRGTALSNPSTLISHSPRLPAAYVSRKARGTTTLSPTNEASRRTDTSDAQCFVSMLLEPEVDVSSRLAGSLDDEVASSLGARAYVDWASPQLRRGGWSAHVLHAVDQFFNRWNKYAGFPFILYIICLLYCRERFGILHKYIKKTIIYHSTKYPSIVAACDLQKTGRNTIRIIKKDDKEDAVVISSLLTYMSKKDPRGSLRTLLDKGSSRIFNS